MPLNKLSITKFNAIVRAGKKGITGDGGGLYLQVSKWRTASWVFRYRSPADGRARWMGLGAVHTVSLAEARDAALLARKAIKARRDPIGERTVRSVTFDVCVNEYLQVRKTATVGWAATLKRHASPRLGEMPVGAITTEAVLQVLTPIWHDKPHTAMRVRRYVETVLEFAGRVKGLRSGENPAAWTQLRHVLPSPKKVRATAHHASMAPVELPEFMAELGQREDVAARALQFLILTASRTGEITGKRAKPGADAKPPLRWSDLDLDRRTWVIPIDKVGNRNFEVPLSNAAIALLRALPREDERVFPMGKNEMWELLGEMRPDVTVHGFRSTFAGWAKDREFADKVVEVSLKHRVHENEIEKAYSKHVTYSPARLRLMQAWGQFAMGHEEAKVLHLSRSS
jgi:integrase